MFGVQIFVMMIFLVLAVLCKTKQELVSIIFFLIHTLVTASNEVTQYGLLQKKITSNEVRTTITSAYNCIESLISILVIAIDGFISNKLGIGIGWIILGIFGIGLFVLLSYWNHRIEAKIGK